MFKTLSLSLLALYQRYVRWMLPGACRFSPTCSEYAQEAIVKYGLLKGLILALRRLSRCNPLCPKTGYDPLL